LALEDANIKITGIVNLTYLCRKQAGSKPQLS
jgi:hypothetical protein